MPECLIVTNWQSACFKHTAGIELATYEQIKLKYPEAVLMFRIKNQYHMMPDDAATAQKILGMPMHTFATSRLEEVLPGLVKAGLKVAICEPTE
jgi:DNA mismatch repair protein MutS